MNRGNFIKSMISLFGLSVLPNSFIKKYCRIYLLQSFVRGFQYYQGPSLLDKMRTGSELDLRRQPDNPFDQFAIELYFNNNKIGYIPAENNEILARLMDAGIIELLAEITHLETNASTWENVHVAVYVLKEITETLPDSIYYLSEIENPEYHTLKFEKNQYARFSNKNQVSFMDGEAFYESLVENSTTHDIYNKIHEGFNNSEEMEEVVHDMKLLTNLNRLPPDLINDPVIHPLEEGIINLDSFFEEKGHTILNPNRLSELSNRIKRFQRLTDIKGRTFFEVIFKS